MYIWGSRQIFVTDLMSSGAFRTITKRTVSAFVCTCKFEATVRFVSSSWHTLMGLILTHTHTQILSFLLSIKGNCYKLSWRRYSVSLDKVEQTSSWRRYNVSLDKVEQTSNLVLACMPGDRHCTVGQVCVVVSLAPLATSFKHYINLLYLLIWATKQRQQNRNHHS